MPSAPSYAAPTKQLRLYWVNHFAVAPGGSGGTRHYEMGRELALRGWDVTIAASDFHYQQRQYTQRVSSSHRNAVDEVIDDVRFRWLWAAPYVRNNWKRVWNWSTFAWSVFRARTHGPPADVVIGSSPHLLAALAAFGVSRRWSVPFVLEVRDLWPESIVAAGGRRGIAYMLFGAMAKFLYARADKIVCLAGGVKAHLESLGIDRGKLVYVPNGVDPAAYSMIDRPSRETFTLIYAGAHGPANGLDVVLDAATLLRGESAIRLVLVGDGPAKTGLMEEAAARGLTNVEFRPPVAKREMPGLFANADAGLMVLRDSPLFSFGVSPNKLFDYFGAALPVVCNVPGDVARMVEDAGAGEQASDGTPEALAAAIMRLFRRPSSARVRMGVAGRAWVTREHGRSMLAARMDEMLRELLNL